MEKKISRSINKEWHEKHKMPEDPTFGQRVKWHLEHQKHCPCRRIAGKPAIEMKQKEIQF